VLVSTEQNTLTWKTEVSANSGSSWQQLGTGTVSSHGLTLSSATTYTDSDPGTGGTQTFATTSGFLFRVTITDAFSNAAVQIVAMTTAAAILDVYSESGQPVGLGIGALYNPVVGGRIQVDGAAFPSAASTSAAGIAEIATESEVRAGDTSRFVTGETFMAVAGMIKVFDQSFTSSAAWSLDGILSSAYRRYKIIMAADLASAATLWLRFRASGVTNTTSNYITSRDYGFSSSAQGISTAATTQVELAAGSGQFHTAEILLINAAQSEKSAVTGLTTTLNSAGTVPYPSHAAGFFTLTNAFDGVSLFSTVAMTGWATVYALL
jgi:hypothetical protein